MKIIHPGEKEGVPVTLLDYQVFWEISHLGSFAAAAKKLHLTPSAISHAVAGMEQECGFSLFQRAKSGVSLTSGGRRLLPAVQQVLASQETFHQTLEEINGLTRGHVAIGAFNSVCTTWLPPLIKLFRSRNPGIQVEVYQGSYLDVCNWLKEGTVDLGILSEDAAREFQFTPLSRDRLVCVVPDNFTPQAGDHIRVEEMEGQPVVLQSPGTNIDIRDFFNRHRLSVQISCHVQDDQACIALVESGLGLCVVPELVLKCFARPIRAYPIYPLEYRVIGLAVVPGTTLTPAARELSNTLLSIREIP